MQTHIFVARAVLVLTVCSTGWTFAASESALVDLSLLEPNEVLVPEAPAASDVPAIADVFVAPEVAIAPVVPLVVAPDIPAEPRAIFGFGVPLASNRLDGFRGGFEVVKNDNQLSGTVTDNLASNVVTGSNSIAEGSFANASGLPMVIQNSGSNVLIQNATIINVRYQ